MGQNLPEGTVTVLFTDIEGSTELAATAGDAAARDLLRDCEVLARRFDTVGTRYLAPNWMPV